MGVLHAAGSLGVGPKEHAFLAATMKSGGIHISNCLGLILGWRRSTLCSWLQAGMQEHDINPHVAGTVLPHGAFLFHQHMRAWPTNVDLLSNFEVKPIVLIRNAADIICSARDSCLRETWLDMDPKGLPGVWIPRAFNGMSREEQELFLVRHLGPWLTSFYVSWRSQELVPCLWVTYEEHFADQVKSFRRMLEWIGWGEDYPTNALERLASMKPHNFNVGRSGRGMDLHPEAMAELERLMDGWGPTWGPLLRRDMLSWPISGSEARPTFSRPSEGSRM